MLPEPESEPEPGLHRPQEPPPRPWPKRRSREEGQGVWHEEWGKESAGQPADGSIQSAMLEAGSRRTGNTASGDSGILAGKETMKGADMNSPEERGGAETTHAAKFAATSWTDVLAAQQGGVFAHAPEPGGFSDSQALAS